MLIAVMVAVVVARLAASGTTQGDPPPEPDCKAVLEMTQSPDLSLIQLTLKNQSSVERVSMVGLTLDRSAFPVELESPEGWIGSGESCGGDLPACFVDWHARNGLAPGAALSGFAVRARDGAVLRVRGTHLHVGDCVMGGVQGGVPANAPPM